MFRILFQLKKPKYQTRQQLVLLVY